MINIEKFFEKAIQCQKDKEIDLAITLYQEILSHDPHHLPSLYNLATVFAESGQYAKAQPYYDLLLELEPDFVRAYYNSAICQLQQKNITQAQRLLEQAVILVPEYSAAQHMLGLILFKQSLWNESKKHLLIALAQDKEQGEVLNHLGMACLHLGELEDAEFYLNLAIEQMPYLAEAQYHLGVIHLKQGKFDTAQQFFQGTVDRDPNHFGAWYNLGLLHKQQGFLKLADECFAKAQALQPDSEYVAFLRAAMNHSQEVEHPPEGFVQDLFDRYASYYDLQMEQGLAYQVPLLLHRQFQAHVAVAPKSLTIVDLGCGTGLTGELFRPQAKYLRGIDLSSFMLEQARLKNCYDDLQHSDLHDAISNLAPGTIDLFIAADVLGYIGKLDQLFALIYQALKPEGYFSFSIELGESGGVTLSDRIRFTHSADYIHQLSEQYGFQVISEDHSMLRKDIEGLCFLIQKKTHL